jgi:hypothetical protein
MAFVCQILNILLTITLFYEVLQKHDELSINQFLILLMALISFNILSAFSGFHVVINSVKECSLSDESEVVSI